MKAVSDQQQAFTSTFEKEHALMGLSVTKLADRGGIEELKANTLAAAKMK